MSTRQRHTPPSTTGAGATLPARRRWGVPSDAHRRPDGWAVLLLFVLTVVAAWPQLVGGIRIGQDSAVAFYPWYSFLGERLRAGDIPAWSPHQFSGAPFAADPQSGWTYWPAMLLFALLPLATAAGSFMFLHLLMAGVFMYGLGRALRMTPAGGLLAAIVYELSAFLYERNTCCFAYTGVMVWLPLLLLCAEMAIRSRAWLHRALWWGAAGLALSQILASWLGQGSYYALLALGGYIAYRTLLSPPPHIQSLRARLLALGLNGAGVLAFGFGLAAAGLLPRLEYNSLSNLAGGYAGVGQQTVFGGWAPRDWAYVLNREDWHYAGAGAVALAALAPILARRRFATPYWTLLALGSLILAGQHRTPLHTLLYLLPGFEGLHPHHPERVLMLFYASVALLAGATWSCLPTTGRKGAALALLPLLGAISLMMAGLQFSGWTSLALLLTLVGLAAYAVISRRRVWLSAGVLLVVFADLLAAGLGVVSHSPQFFQKEKVDLTAYYAPTGAAVFLKAQAGGGPVRYFGYDPQIRLNDVPYRFQFGDPMAAAIMVNNRATILGLQDVQGYDPIHVARYDEYMAALNGVSQEYRGSYVLEGGLGSPLLHLLNARYIVIPASIPPGRTDLQTLVATHPTRYSDNRVRVLENPHALPRAWLTHSARQVSKGDALQLLASGKVNPRTVALLEDTPPPLASPADPTREEVVITGYEAERISVRARASTPALLVLSEVYYPAWKAYVDGEPAKVYVTDHALRGVAVAAGEHTVELRYESATLGIGLAVSALFYLLLVGLGTATCYRLWKSGAIRGRLYAYYPSNG